MEDLSGVRLIVYRGDGRSGRYAQADPRRAAMLALRLDPATLFTSGALVIGVLNPFTVLNADEVCWIEVEGAAGIALPEALPPGVDGIRKLASREDYEALLARQWPRWREAGRGREHDLVEALVELSFRGGHMLYLHVTGRDVRVPLTDAIFGQAATTARIDGGGMAYVNPRAVVRARVYHSLQAVDYPPGLLFMEAEEI